MVRKSSLVWTSGVQMMSLALGIGWELSQVPLLHAQQVDPASAEFQKAVTAGKKLFERDWLSATDKSIIGDGIGPMFNAVSCVACHNQGGTGGGGPIEANAEILNIFAIDKVTAEQEAEIKAWLKTYKIGVTPVGETFVASTILHKFSTNPAYAELRAKLTGASTTSKATNSERELIQQTMAVSPVRPVVVRKPIALALSQRNTTAIWGDGLLDQIPDTFIHQLASAQARQFPRQAGRVAPAGGSGIGRFGWRGQVEHLRNFVAGACTNELGLQVNNLKQAIDPLRPDNRPDSPDMSQDEFTQLTAFCFQLSRPETRLPADADARRLVDRGREVFQSVGCAVCHVENLGLIKEVYSDLLLHDMGPQLVDMMLARPAMQPSSQTVVSKLSAFQQAAAQPSAQFVQETYYGVPIGMVLPRSLQQGQSLVLFDQVSGPRSDQVVFRDALVKTVWSPVISNLAQEWRTPPLWGVADSAPYLHDGRAATLLEAIALHGGQGQESADKFVALPTSDRVALIEFLNCLKAPAVR